MTGEIEAKQEPKGNGGDGTWKNVAISLAFLAVLGWGLVSLGFCAWRGIERHSERTSVERAIRAEDDARRKAAKDFNASAGERRKRATPEEAGYSDTAVTAAALQAVKWKLSDPASAKFRSVRVYRQGSGTKAVCGEFNAKNRAGGYNGYERFVSAGTVEHTWLEQQVEGMDAVWQSVCR